MKEAKTKFKFTKLQKIVLSIGLLGLIAVIGFGIFGENRPIIKKDGTITEKATEDGGKIIEVDEGMKEPVEEEFPLTMEDYEIANKIHAMSHQKIEADEKWGFLPLTTERVTRLIDVIETNKNEYTNSNLYLRILNRWLENDFSQIDRDHNEVWSLQGGTIGKATGILSYEEELEYIEKYYD
jgi:hypothetical protein